MGNRGGIRGLRLVGWGRVGGGRWNDRKPLKLLGLLAMSLPGGK